MAEERQESWIEILSSVVAGLRSSETLSELAVQAREMLAELRPQAGRETDRSRECAADEDESRDDRGEDSDEAGEGAVNEGSCDDPDVLAARLDALAASVEELTDLLDAGLERLETVEMQLGDPDENVDAQVSGAVERCQSRLAAIEHRLGAVASMLRDAAAGEARGAVLSARPGASPLQILVIDSDSGRRCAICIALEHQGLRCIAVADSAAAAARFRVLRPDAVLIDVDADPEEVGALAALLAGFDAATTPAPPVLVVFEQRLGRVRAAAARQTFGNWPLLCSGEGEAALAAAVMEHARRQDGCADACADACAVPETDLTEETTRHAFDAESHVEFDGSCDAACDVASE